MSCKASQLNGQQYSSCIGQCYESGRLGTLLLGVDRGDSAVASRSGRDSAVSITINMKFWNGH